MIAVIVLVALAVGSLFYFDSTVPAAILCVMALAALGYQMVSNWGERE